MAYSPAAWFQRAYQINPILLTHGIASNMPGGAMSLLSITNSGLFPNGVLTAAANIDLDKVFPQFMPLPGGTYIDQEVATYPFANQAVAANAVIQNPLRFSMRMIFPTEPDVGYRRKNQIVTALISTLYRHNISGGTYTVSTPSYTFTECLLPTMRVTDDNSKQPQAEWQLDFIQPLLTEAQAAQIMNNLYNKITVGSRFTQAPAFSGAEPTVNLPQSLAGASLVPAINAAGLGITAAPLQPFPVSGQ